MGWHLVRSASLLSDYWSGCGMMSGLGGSFLSGCGRRRSPKGVGKVRSLGIPTAADRVVQTSLKLVLEPIISGRTSNHARMVSARNVEDRTPLLRSTSWRRVSGTTSGCSKVDIEACFDTIDHNALMNRVRNRIGDKRVLRLVKAFLKAGVVCEDGSRHRTSPAHPGVESCRLC